MFKSSLAFIFVLFTLVEFGATQPQERMRVKYRIKSGGGKRIVDKAVAEAVPVVEGGFQEGSFPDVLEERQLKEFEVNSNQIQGSESLLQEEEEKLMVPANMEDMSQDEFAETVVGMGEELQEGLGDIFGKYGTTVVEIAQGINRAARFNERSVGDIMADVVKEVVAEVIGGVMSKAFGIGTAREGGEGLIEIILGAISRSGQPKSC
ncbi:uncharacterized protein LOC111695300 [Eurytemora carolleeae]|uniref:uncharacterized protein LOC111695300 n=1 Tax=Eurytemora carolleeae TaxID=1294199 RepID=UPI000C790091|nr:uncharacterized protein LOC111695300 [Eurytemora carolleeae]|eukprot:XP_023320332.1 uncharacterized protein LOC111695300 [Eurytemora affinis]